MENLVIVFKIINGVGENHVTKKREKKRNSIFRFVDQENLFHLDYEFFLEISLVVDPIQFLAYNNYFDLKLKLKKGFNHNYLNVKFLEI